MEAHHKKICIFVDCILEQGFLTHRKAIVDFRFPIIDYR